MPSVETAALRVNPDRIRARLDAMAKIGRDPAGGVMRLAYSQADRDACELVEQWLREAGLEPSIDFGANVFGRRKGDRKGKPLLVGSHVDSVPNGGDFDGPLGVIAAIEVAQIIAEHRVATRHPIEVVSWSNEEGGLYGSRAVSGEIHLHELSNIAASGKTIGDGIAFLGGDPRRLADVRRAAGSIAAYLELHIEQGATLEESKVDIGVVEGIVGIFRVDVGVFGTTNHAGTTPMDRRHDALLAAARFIDMVNRVVRSTRGNQRGTVGKIAVLPSGGAANLVPGHVLCTLELRDLDRAKIALLYEEVQAEARAIGEVTGTTFEFQVQHENIPAPCDPKVQQAIADAAMTLGLSSRVMPSGAGHDTQSMAKIGPAGMIFIPSVGGISHSPREYSTPRDVENGANVLLQAFLKLDDSLE